MFERDVMFVLGATEVPSGFREFIKTFDYLVAAVSPPSPLHAYHT